MRKHSVWPFVFANIAAVLLLPIIIPAVWIWELLRREPEWNEQDK